MNPKEAMCDEMKTVGKFPQMYVMEEAEVQDVRLFLL